MLNKQCLALSLLFVSSTLVISCGKHPSPQQLQEMKLDLGQVKPVKRGTSLKPQLLDLLDAQKKAQALLTSSGSPEERSVAVEALERLHRQLEVEAQLPSQNRIINARPARPGQFPYEAALILTGYKNPFDGQYCGGTLIAPQWVLTAGHCVSTSMQPADIQVLVGSTKLSQGGRPVELASICRHPQYGTADGHSVNDLALLKLATPVPDLQPIGTPDPALETTMLKFTRNATVIGWGDTGSGTGSDDLLFGTMQVIDNPSCSKSYHAGDITDGMVCAIDKLTNTCHGDSGGPLIMRNKAGDEFVEGITSWGDPDCTKNKVPGVYAHVPSYASWVQNTLGTAPDCQK